MGNFCEGRELGVDMLRQRGFAVPFCHPHALWSATTRMVAVTFYMHILVNLVNRYVFLQTVGQTSIDEI